MLPTIEKPPLPAVALKSSKVSTPPDGPSILSRPPPSQGSATPSTKPKSTAAEEAGGSAKTVSVTQKDKVPSPALALGGETATVAKAAGVVNMSDLRNCLITLLVDNPKGMTIKVCKYCCCSSSFRVWVIYSSWCWFTKGIPEFQTQVLTYYDGLILGSEGFSDHIPRIWVRLARFLVLFGTVPCPIYHVKRF